MVCRIRLQQLCPCHRHHRHHHHVVRWRQLPMVLSPTLAASASPLRLATSPLIS